MVDVGHCLASIGADDEDRSTRPPPAATDLQFAECVDDTPWLIYRAAGSGIGLRGPHVQRASRKAYVTSVERDRLAEPQARACQRRKQRADRRSAGLYQRQKPLGLDPGSLRLRALIGTCCATRPAATLSRPAVNPSF
jgi:hypothetical protein